MWPCGLVANFPREPHEPIERRHALPHVRTPLFKRPDYPLVFVRWHDREKGAEENSRNSKILLPINSLGKRGSCLLPGGPEKEIAEAERKKDVRYLRPPASR